MTFTIEPHGRYAIVTEGDAVYSATLDTAEENTVTFTILSQYEDYMDAWFDIAGRAAEDIIAAHEAVDEPTLIEGSQP